MISTTVVAYLHLRDSQAVGGKLGFFRVALSDVSGFSKRGLNRKPCCTRDKARHCSGYLSFMGNAMPGNQRRRNCFAKACTASR